MNVAFYGGPGDVITTLIKLVSQGEFSHTELVFSDGRWIGASGRGKDKGVRWAVVPLSLDNWIFVTVDATEEQEKEIRRLAVSQIGQPFDWKGVISHLIPWLESDDGFYCTNFIVRLMHAVGLWKDIPAHITPSDLYQRLSADSNRRIEE